MQLLRLSKIQIEEWNNLLQYKVIASVTKIDDVLYNIHPECVTSREGINYTFICKDLKGAYTLLSFRPEDVGLFAMLLTEDVVYFQLAGIFGWSGTPAAFQVVTRAITWELRHALRSSTVMYVDDIIRVCFASDLESDLAITRRVCTDLLGSGAVADDKTEHGVRLDVIGYTLDLTQERVLIARKNFLTALHGFISTDVTQRLNLKAAQRLALRKDLQGHAPILRGAEPDDVGAS